MKFANFMTLIDDMKTLLLKIVSYLDIRTMFSGNHKVNVNLRMMHGMNRISIFLFLICLVLMLIRYVL